MKPRFFASATQWRAWLEANHESRTELLVGFHRSGSGRPSMSWPKAVDEALCVGWIDGVRRSIDEHSYSIRFSRRRKGSIWSLVNIAKAESLIAAGRMRQAGLAEYQRRSAARSGVYSFEQDNPQFDAATRAAFTVNRRAWAFFTRQPPSYRKKVTWWIMGARRPATRLRRLARAVESFDRNTRL